MQFFNNLTSICQAWRKLKLIDDRNIKRDAPGPNKDLTTQNQRTIGSKMTK